MMCDAGAEAQILGARRIASDDSGELRVLLHGHTLQAQTRMDFVAWEQFGQHTQVVADFRFDRGDAPPRVVLGTQYDHPLRIHQSDAAVDRVTGRVLGLRTEQLGDTDSAALDLVRLDVDCGVGVVIPVEDYLPQEVASLELGDLVEFDGYFSCFPRKPISDQVHVGRLPVEVRTAILRYHGENAADQSETDPRWIEEWRALRPGSPTELAEVDQSYEFNGQYGRRFFEEVGTARTLCSLRGSSNRSPGAVRSFPSRAKQ